MTITYQLESWTDYYRDCQALWIEHYDEIATNKDKMPMQPDIETFMEMERQGKLQILVARIAGCMIGYQVSIIARHLHYSVLCGYEDSYFLTKKHRKGFAGIRLIKEAIRHMKNRGVKKIFFHTKAFADKGRLFDFLGFSKSDILYSKWIGD